MTKEELLKHLENAREMLKSMQESQQACNDCDESAIDYDTLATAYDDAASCCDPYEFQNRLKVLLFALTNYTLNRDKPE
jgi:hypothetical protein